MQSKSGVSYYVQLSDGDVHRVSLDQLDEGFQAGHIDENTMVLADGASKWVSLSELAGLEEDVHVEVEPYSAPAASTPPLSAYVQPRVAAPAYAPATYAPANGIAAATGSVAPARRASVYGRPPSFAAPILPSHRPVSIDLGEVQFRPQGSGRRWLAAVAAIAVIGGVGTAAVKRPGWVQPYLGRLGIHITGPMPVAAPPVAAAQVVAAPAPPPAPVSPALITATVATPEPTPAAPADPPRALGLKAKAPKARAMGAVPAHPLAPKKARGTSSFVTTGGGRFDPLGSNI